MSILYLCELMAVVVSAVYGVLLASRKGMDVVGVFTVAFAAAFGGGTLRDLFLDRNPLFWIKNAHYPVIVFGIAILSGPIVRHIGRIRPLLPLPDALGMALFTLTGTAYAVEAGTSAFVAVLLGVITGTFGGVLADILCNQIPTLFIPSPLNATCAFAGAWVYLGMLHFAAPERYALAAGLAVIVALRLAAIRWNWTFPAVRAAKEGGGPPG
ncbi:MAG TPA: trimeric intracellular cation channel family protein [Bacteroidia bacterium]|nr:trimeric intracellular cation channel family protein [Bacteroidia bacterium]